MFRKINRFSFKKGAPRKVYSTPYFVIRYENGENDNFECAVVIGKKVDKKAVERNRIKRQVVGIVKKSVPMDKNFRVVIYGRKQIKEIAQTDLEQELLKSLKQIKIN